MKTRRYKLDKNVFKTLTDSDLHWYATARAGIDIALNLEINKIDVFSIYIPEDEEDKWKTYLRSAGAKTVQDLPNLIMIPSTDYQMMIDATLENAKNLDQGTLDYLIKTDSSFEILLKVEKTVLERGYSLNYSFGSNSTHISAEKTLEEDIKKCPRHAENLFTRKTNKKPLGEHVSFSQLKLLYGC